MEGEDYEEYQGFTWGMERRGKVSQMLGHPDQVQPAILETTFSDVRRMLFPEIKKEPPFGDPFFRECRLLLQLGFDVVFHEYPFYFYAREDDTRKRDFSRVWGMQTRG